MNRTIIIIITYDRTISNFFSDFKRKNLTIRINNFQILQVNKIIYDQLVSLCDDVIMGAVHIAAKSGSYCVDKA